MDTLYKQLQFLFEQYKRLDNYLKPFGVNRTIDTRKKLNKVLSQIVLLDTMFKYVEQFGVTRYASELFEIESELKWLYIYFDLDWTAPQTGQNSTAEQ